MCLICGVTRRVGRLGLVLARVMDAFNGSNAISYDRVALHRRPASEHGVVHLGEELRVAGRYQLAGGKIVHGASHLRAGNPAQDQSERAIDEIMMMLLASAGTGSQL